MVAPKLGRPRHLAVASAAVLGSTLAAGLVGVLDPAIAGSTTPHPTLTGNLSDWLVIATENLRVVATPFLLWLLGLHTSQLGRRAGDALIVVVIAVNTSAVGTELGRWRGQLIPYLPQLPLEWGALILAVSAWLTIRTTAATRRQVAALASTTTILLAAAATLETWATPHRHERTSSHIMRVDTARAGPLPGGCTGVVACATKCAPGRPGRCKVASSLPLTPLGSARPNPGADRATSTTPGPPQGGTTT
jgi:hypothetical protein